MKRLLAGLVVLVLAGCSAPTFHVGGTLQLNSARTATIGADGGCPLSYDGYADIRPGTQVTVYDEAGKAVATGRLGMNSGVGNVGQETSRCYFAFDIDGVPEGSKIYAVEVSHRGQVRFNRDALRSLIELRIGA